MSEFEEVPSQNISRRFFPKPNTNHYEARASHLTLSATVSAAPGEANASVAIRSVLTIGRDSGNPRRYTVTIEAIAKHDQAQAVFFGEDADADASGHQIALGGGGGI